MNTRIKTNFRGVKIDNQKQDNNKCGCESLREGPECGCESIQDAPVGGCEGIEKPEKIEKCYFCLKEFDINKDDDSHYKFGKYPMCAYCSEFYGFYAD